MFDGDGNGRRRRRRREEEGAVTLSGALREKALWNYQPVHRGIANLCDLPVPAVHTPKYNGAQHDS